MTRTPLANGRIFAFCSGRGGESIVERMGSALPAPVSSREMGERESGGGEYLSC